MGGRSARRHLSASWPLFGLVWPAGLALADEMSRFAVAREEASSRSAAVAGLSSLVLQQRGADVTASDHHPLAQEFLRVNAALNDLPRSFSRGVVDRLNPDLGRFDLIIASDVLYERGHPSRWPHFSPAMRAHRAGDRGRSRSLQPRPLRRRDARGRLRSSERRRDFPGGAAGAGRIMSFVRTADGCVQPSSS